ncbi:hypothetical protein HR12_11220 [Microbacterium sp. SUBG005]|nr:hypothetical protein HR12_11220 [Microbacterium sp. SUBG005]
MPGGHGIRDLEEHAVLRVPPGVLGGQGVDRDPAGAERDQRLTALAVDVKSRVEQAGERQGTDPGQRDPHLGALVAHP